MHIHCKQNWVPNSLHKFANSCCCCSSHESPPVKLVLINCPFAALLAEPPRQVEEKGATTEDGLHRHEQSFDESRATPRSPVLGPDLDSKSAGKRWQLDELPDDPVRADPLQSVIACQQSVRHIQQPPVRYLRAREPGLSHATALWIRKSFPRRSSGHRWSSVAP